MVFHDLNNNIISCNTFPDNRFNSWCVNIQNYMDYVSDIKEVLSKHELTKCQAISNENAKRIFILRKGITKIILGNYLEISPNRVDYCYTEYGKPYFDKKYQDIYFNISHSKEFLMVAITQSKNIGVDVEKININKNISVMAKSVFSQDELRIFNNHGNEDKTQMFYNTWVKKEAISKAIGLGIAVGFNTFSVANKGNVLLNINGSDKSVKAFNDCTNEYHYAVAIEI